MHGEHDSFKDVKMNEISFSLIVPAYNVAAYLKDCLDSLVSLSGSNFEVIIANDGSTDNGEAICLEYAEKYPFIRYFYKENGGLSSARNFGINQAKGDYLWFIDSDDFLLNNDCLIKFSELLKDHPVDLALFLPLEFNEDRTAVVIQHPATRFPLKKTFCADAIIDDLYASENPYITMAQTKLIRRQYLLEHNLYFTENTYHEDDEWIARVLLTNPTLVLSDLEEYGYRHRGNSIVTSTNPAKRLKRYYNKLKIADTILGSEGICRYRNCVTYFMAYYIGAVSDICRCDGEAERFLDTPDPENVFRTIRYSLSRKHRWLYLYAKIFGIKNAKKFMVKKLKQQI